jgi:signal peptidase II
MSDHAPARAGLSATLPAALLALAVDQVSKLWILHGLDLPHLVTVDVAPPFLRFVMAWNTGVNFGLGDGVGSGLWIALALAICTGLALWTRRMPSPWRRAAAGLVIGGALGNALDRALYGAVVDFLNVSCCGIRNPYAFNLADVFIFAGAGGLILLDGSDNQET